MTSSDGFNFAGTMVNLVPFALVIIRWSELLFGPFLRF